MYTEDELLPLSGLQHIAYCERQWALIHVEQIWSDSADTVRGELFHRRVDTEGYTCAKGVRSDRSVRVVSFQLGLYGVADIVEYDAQTGEIIMPAEYKVGKPKQEDWDRLQLTAQAMSLEEMAGACIDAGALFYGETRRRETVRITQELRERVVLLAQRMHGLFSKGVTPPPPTNVRCKRCSLVDDCAPFAQRDVHAYWAEHERALEVDT